MKYSQAALTLALMAPSTDAFWLPRLHVVPSSLAAKAAEFKDLLDVDPSSSAAAVVPPPVGIEAAPSVVASQDAFTTTTFPTAGDVVNSIMKPAPGVGVISQKVEDSYRPNFAAPHTPPSIDWNAFENRWGNNNGDFSEWFKNKVSHGWQASGPVNTGPPKLMEQVQANAEWNKFAFRGPLEDAGQHLATSYSMFQTSLAQVSAMTSGGGVQYTQADWERALNLQQTGGWYMGILGTLAVMWWKVASPTGSGSGITTAATPKTTPVYNTLQAVPRGGMTPALQRTNAAQTRLAAVSKAEADIERRETMVAQQVSQLAQATKAVTEQLASLQDAKSQRDYDVATMKSDLQELRNDLYSTQKSENELRMSLERTQAKLETETQSLRKQLEERMQAEAAVRKQLQETKSKMQQEMRTIAVAKNQAEMNVVQAKNQVAALEKQKQAMEKQISTLKAQVQDLQAKLKAPAATSTTVKGFKAAPAPAAPPVAEKAAPVSAPVANKVTKVVAKKSTKSASKKKVEALSKAFFANITEPVAAAPTHAVAPKVAKKASAPKTIRVKKASAPKTIKKAPKEAPGPDFSSMSASALKRKKVQELQDYLAEQVPVSILLCTRQTFLARARFLIIIAFLFYFSSGCQSDRCRRQTAQEGRSGGSNFVRLKCRR